MGFASKISYSLSSSIFNEPQGRKLCYMRSLFWLPTLFGMIGLFGCQAEAFEERCFRATSLMEIRSAELKTAKEEYSLSCNKRQKLYGGSCQQIEDFLQAKLELKNTQLKTAMQEHLKICIQRKRYK